jgi:glycosyltransferase involved in cell wall biosynthesis
MIPESITVITISRHRPELLARAVASVRAQRCGVPIEHVTIIDDCAASADLLRKLEREAPVRWELAPRTGEDSSGPRRLAALRNQAVAAAGSRWISFLDDDNEFLPGHLETLAECARSTGSRAVHSHMQLFTKDGRPYLEERMPWWPDPVGGRDLYQVLRAQGVFEPGSNIVRDRADPLGTQDPVRSVDTGEWLLERSLLLECPFSAEYSEEDWGCMRTEDDKLLEALIERGISIRCTGKATLKYYLGGYSNSFRFD